MKEKVKWIMLIIIIILIISIALLLFNCKSGEYHFTGAIRDLENNIEVDVFIIQSNNGNLLTYSTTINYSEEEIVASRLYYEQEGKKIIALGNRLNSYNYSKKGQDKREYGYDYIDHLLKYPLYFELCKDSQCEDIYKTVKLEYDKLY